MLTAIGGFLRRRLRSSAIRHALGAGPLRLLARDLGGTSLVLLVATFTAAALVYAGGAQIALHDFHPAAAIRAFVHALTLVGALLLILTGWRSLQLARAPALARLLTDPA